MADTPLAVNIISDADAIGSAKLHESWTALANRCPWATFFQHPRFVATWYETYRPTYAPYLVCGWRGERLEGLLPLAIASADGKPAIAGTYQAEYQSWLADPSDGGAFVSDALRIFGERFSRADLTFRYLPHGAPVEHLTRAGYGARLTQVLHQRPLMRIDGDALAKSLAKKSNKSRFNRLKRMGKVTLDRLTTGVELESAIDDVIWQYDLRQGAINRSTPFLEDPFKRQFHLSLMSQPDTLHVTVLRVDETVVSSHIDYLDRKWSYLGVPSHSPFYFQHSPGKLHMLLLGKLLANEGVECLDLTPGGDPWKERFANDHDDVFEVSVHRSVIGRVRDRLPVTIRTGLSKAISGIGVDPKRLKTMLARVHGLRSLGGNRTPFESTDARASLHRLGECDPVKLGADDADELSATINRPSDLLLWMNGETLAAKHTLLSVALDRLEHNHDLVTCVDGDALLGYGWVVKDPAKAGLSNTELRNVPGDGTLLHGILVTEPQRTGQAQRTLLKAMLVEACEQSSNGAVFVLIDESVVATIRALQIELADPNDLPESSVLAAAKTDHG